MAHELEQLTDGSTAFVTARVPAWHKLGTVADGPMTAADMLELSGLGRMHYRLSFGMAGYVPGGKCADCGRTVGAKHTQKCPVPREQGRPEGQEVTEIDTVELLVQPGAFQVYRELDGDLRAMGVVSEQYPIVQPPEVAEFLQSVADVSGSVFETAGALRDGRDIFMTMKMPEGITIGGTDEVDLYLAGMQNYSGQAKLKIITTPVRVVCANTERAALRNTRSEYTFRHSPSLAGKLQEAREALKINFDWTSQFQAEAESMINTTMTNRQFDELVKAMWPEKFDKPLDDWRKPEHEQWNSLASLFRSADTQENVRGTVWGGYNSIVEYLDWEVPVIGKDDPAEIVAARANRNFTGEYSPLKTRAFDLALDIVSAA